MRVSRAALEVLKVLEGSSKSVYKDSAGHYTIGVGHLLMFPTDQNLTLVTGKDPSDIVHDDIKLTDEQVMELLSLDLKRFESNVDKALKGTMINQQEFDALVLFTFNVGIGNLLKGTIIKAMQNLDVDLAAKTMLRYIRAGNAVSNGLLKRRCVEVNIMLYPDVKLDLFSKLDKSAASDGVHTVLLYKKIREEEAHE